MSNEASQTLGEIRALLMEREKQARGLSELDAKIAELAGIEKERRPSKRKPLSGSDLRRACGVPV